LSLFGIVRRTLLTPRLRERWEDAATPLAFAVAFLWAVHPLLTEAVTYVVQRTEVLAGLFYLVTFYCVIRGATAARGWGWYAAAVAACALAMGSKEAAISAPLVVLLYDRVFLSRSWHEVLARRWGLYIGLAATWTVILAMLPRGYEGTAVFTVLQTPDAVRVIGEGHRMIDYTLAQFGVIAHYLKLCFWPHPLVVDYGLYTQQTAWQIVPYALLIGGLLVATLAALRYQPWLGFLGVWFFA
jgi:protein O-mannosyl-transferase